MKPGGMGEIGAGVVCKPPAGAGGVAAGVEGDAIGVLTGGAGGMAAGAVGVLTRGAGGMAVGAVGVLTGGAVGTLGGVGGMLTGSGCVGLGRVDPPGGRAGSIGLDTAGIGGSIGMAPLPGIPGLAKPVGVRTEGGTGTAPSTGAISILLIRALGKLKSTFTAAVVWVNPWLPARSLQEARTKKANGRPWGGIFQTNLPLLGKSLAISVQGPSAVCE